MALETSQDKLEWSALEYEEKERSQDWFWALGIIIIAAGAAAIIFGNYFFAVLVVLGGVLLGFFAIKKPEIVSYQLSERGLRAGNRVFLFENINSFWVQIAPKPTLFIKSERFFMPIISIPIKEGMAEDVHDIFTFKNIPEEEMKEHFSDRIMESLGF